MNFLPKATRLAPAMGAAAIGAAAWVLIGPAAADADPDPLGEFTGGATTVHTTGRNSFSFPLANLDDAERTSWIKNSRLKASDVGLTEEPYAPPCDVVFLPGCPGGPP